MSEHWRYRPWAGFTLWGAFTPLDVVTWRSGVLTFVGFVLAFAWARFSS